MIILGSSEGNYQLRRADAEQNVCISQAAFSESHWQPEISCGRSIFTLEISKHGEPGLIFSLGEPVVKHLPTSHWVEWGHTPTRFPIRKCPSTSNHPSSSFFNLFFFSSLVFMYFHRSSSLTVANYSNVFNVYNIYVGVHSWKMCFAVLCTCI